MLHRLRCDVDVDEDVLRVPVPVPVPVGRRNDFGSGIAMSENTDNGVLGRGSMHIEDMRGEMLKHEIGIRVTEGQGYGSDPLR